MRIGSGYATAPFSADRPLVLGGVRLRDGSEGGVGTTTDVVSTVLASAIRGAAGLPAAENGEDGSLDAGEAAPPGSGEILDRTVRSVEAENYQVVNVDVSVFTGSVVPSRLLREHGRELRRRLAERLHVRPDQVSVKAAARGAPERIDEEAGLAAAAVVLLDQITDLDGLLASARSGR